MTTQAEPRPVQPGTDTSGVPFRITDPGRVPSQRYVSPEFSRLEKEKLWPHVWQMACRLEEIPRPGDFTEYKIGDQSILVVRESEDSVKAYFNACRHRATALGVGSGTFHGGQIVCPYHGWRWNLDGSNSYVYAQRGFKPGCLDADFLKLRECQVGTLFGMVFINMDPAAPPLHEAMAGIAEALAPIGFERMRVRWWRHVVLPANWKIAQEAFMEAYHVMQAHPSLAMGMSDEDFDVDSFAGEFECFPGGHAHSLPLSEMKVPVQGMSAAEYFVQYNNALYFGTDAYATEREMFIQQGLLERDIEPEQFPAAFFQALYDYAAGAGIALPPPAQNTSGYGHIFPNITVLPAYGNSIIYRVRPNGDNPESCIFEVWAVQIPAEGDEPGQPELEGPIPVDDWPQILKEDFYNILAQQQGLRTQGSDELVLSESYEAMIVNNHRTIDEYLAR
ncbi:aromatic ring-hydroxylating dioxygenase subunit alpha [Amycolatopsis sp.]|uniref:aromatic ring-hydroxylating oxygenase subunit alpha n=1 Tax=Amycolatopsis sp. TaxID=37632 RepID=UPI002D1949A8|nr:aromatic ring-hydroxylating dioxygenase subunit alpha [Amycolatopsis sp.]HVV08106.1 aromatic ring-hydroxylating dioxygenase subunit alpha [Amycolatopsis sp.]